jgi:photosystem II stability/assembly factor-like uncharacterized protein
MAAPSDPKTIYLGSSDLSNGCGVFKSTDGGLSWTAQNNGIGQVGLFSQHYLPVTTFAATPDPSTIYFGAYSPLGGSVYKTTNGGASWSPASGTVNFFGNAEISNAISLASNPNNPNTVYAGLLSNGVYKTTSGGQHWQQIRSGGPSDVFHIVRFVDNQTLLTAGGTTYDSAPCFMGPSTLGGWESIDCSGVLPLGPALTTDGGSHWNYLTYTGAYPVNSIFFSGLESVQVNGIWSSFASTMGAGIVVGPIPAIIGPKGIFKVTAGGNAWMKTAGVDSSGKDYAVTGLTIDLKDPSKIFSYIPGKTIYQSHDGGSSWSPIDLPVGASSINKLQAGGNRLYALTDQGIFVYDYTPGFSTGVNGATRVITQGQSTTFGLTIASQGNFNAPVSLYAINLPSGYSSSTNWSPATVTPPANGQATSTLTIYTTNTTATGTFTITLRAAANGYPTKDIPVTLTINPPVQASFTTSVNATSRSITQGQSTTFGLTIASQGNFNAPVSLYAINLPSGYSSSTNWSPATVTPPANGQATSTLTIYTTNTTATGTFTITLRAPANGYPTKDIPVTLTINPGMPPSPFFTGLGYSPNPAKAAQVVTLAFYGGNFISGTTQVWFVGPGCAGQGCQTTAVTVVSSAYMSAQAVFNNPGSYAVNVRNGSGGWVTAGTISVVR